MLSVIAPRCAHGGICQRGSRQGCARLRGRIKDLISLPLILFPQYFPCVLHCSISRMATPVATYTEKHTYKVTWTNTIAPGAPLTTQTSVTIYYATPGTFLANYTVYDPFGGADSQVISDTVTISTFPAASTGTPTTSTASSPQTSSTQQSPSNAATQSTVRQSLTSASSPTTVLKPTSSTTTSIQHTTSSSTTPKSGGVSSGVAAGIGIGCAVAGAILAAIALFFLMRRRRRSEARQPRTSSLPRQEKRSSGGPSYPETTLAPVAKSNTMSAVEAALAPPMQDRDISGDMSKLGIAIKNHAHSYYSGTIGPQALTTGSERAISSLLGSDAPMSSTDLAALLSNPKSTTTAVRFLIGWSILRRVELSCPPETSLLPPELAECLEGMKSFQGNGDGMCAVKSA